MPNSPINGYRGTIPDIHVEDDGTNGNDNNNNGNHNSWNNEVKRRRKQPHPQRSLKQLASVAEKVLHGIIIIEPVLPWERHHHHHSSSMGLPLRRGRRSNISDEEEEEALESASSVSSNTSITGGMGGTISHSSTSINRPTVTRSPAPMGTALPEDTFEPGLSHRRALYDSILARRRSSPANNRGGMPLDITSAPGSSLLADADFEICSTLRLYPLQFFQSRDTLLRNYRERGFYKKSAAQKMLHIDVNKTGKLYDYFVSRGWMPISDDAGDRSRVRFPPSIDWHVIAP